MVVKFYVNLDVCSWETSEEVQLSDVSHFSSSHILFS